MKGYVMGKPFYQANVWIRDGGGDPLLLEEFTTKREAVSCIKNFRKRYSGQEELDCYVVHFDEDEFSKDSFNV